LALEAAFDRLCIDLRKLRDLLHDVDVNIGDKPEAEGVLLVDDMSDGVTELVGLSEECLSTAEEARRFAGPTFEPNQMRRSLAESQKQFHSLSKILWSNLLSYDRISALVQFGSKHSPEWRGWVDSVRQGLDRSQPAVEAVEEAYFQCWHEIAERVTASPVSLSTTNIGQYITTAALETAEAAREGIT
jgi:hypothetical protein